MKRRTFFRLLIGGAVCAPLVKPLALLAIEPPPPAWGALTLRAMNEAFRCCTHHYPGVKVLITTKEVRDAYVALLEPWQRWTDRHTFEYTNVNYKGVPILDQKTFTHAAGYGAFGLRPHAVRLELVDITERYVTFSATHYIYICQPRDLRAYSHYPRDHDGLQWRGRVQQSASY